MVEMEQYSEEEIAGIATERAAKWIIEKEVVVLIKRKADGYELAGRFYTNDQGGLIERRVFLGNFSPDSFDFDLLIQRLKEDIAKGF
jgi:hypothetical protein